jgi:PAS domain-containing protein
MMPSPKSPGIAARTRCGGALAGCCRARRRIIHFLGLQRDITERKRREKELNDLSNALLSEKNRLSESQAVARVGSWQTDLSTLAVPWTEETFRIFESRPDAFEPMHKKFLSFVHPDDRERVHDAFTHSAGQPGAFSIEHRLLFSNGRVKYVEERWQTFTDAMGQPTLAVDTCQGFPFCIPPRRKSRPAMNLNGRMRMNKM